MDAEIIAVGSELLTPFHQDTNSLFLTDKLNSLGIEVRFKTIVGDDAARLESVLRQALTRSQLIVLTGGLGPTEDDINRSVVAEVVGRPLNENADVRKRLTERFARANRPMPENNLRQAMVPDGADVIENRNGTAPGLWIEHNGIIVIMLPGPPRELAPMFETECLPRLARLSSGRRIRSRVYVVSGLPESEVDQRIAPVYKKYENPVTTILAAPGGIEVHLRAGAATDVEAEALLSELGDQIEIPLGDHLISSKGETIEEIVGMYLVLKQKTLAAAESCTGGLISERLTRVPGSSNFFLGGVVCYSNGLKTALVGVPEALLKEHGAVSKPVAQALAEGIRRRSRASIGIGITGIAGPSGGTPEKPVGMVIIGLADERSTQVREFRFPGNRERVRWLASQAALEIIRRRLRD
jgi:competence/damage-inducible protein CinA-like protein